MPFFVIFVPFVAFVVYVVSLCQGFCKECHVFG